MELQPDKGNTIMTIIHIITFLSNIGFSRAGTAETVDCHYFLCAVISTDLGYICGLNDVH